MGQVPDHLSPNGIAMTTSTHAAAVLHIVAFNFAATSSALVIGRVALNGVRPYPPLAEGFEVRTVAAPKTAMTGGVTSTPASMMNTNEGVLPVRKSRASSHGNRMAIHTGSDRP